MASTAAPATSSSRPRNGRSPSIRSHYTRLIKNGSAEVAGRLRLPGEDAGWIITLSDLTLLLLAFGVVWYVTNGRQAARERSKIVVEQVVADAPAEVEAISAEETAASDNEAWSGLRTEMEQYLAEARLTEKIAVASTQHGLFLTFEDKVPFNSGKAELQRELFPVLDKLVEIAERRPELQIQIAGHTDDRPISTPEFPSNWELSAARAARVARYLGQRGIEPGRLSIQGHAAFLPLAPNVGPDGRQANRRVEIRLYRTVDEGRLENSGVTIESFN
jgi:chemotaxis protein MotB